MLVLFKFELNMCVAIPFCTIGLVVLLAATDYFRWWLTIGPVVLGPVLSFGFFRLARDTSHVLARVRNELTQGVGVPPFGAAGNPTPTSA